MQSTEVMTNADKAEQSLLRAFKSFVLRIEPSNLEDFFHGMNRSVWQKAFAHYLIERNEEASND